MKIFETIKAFNRFLFRDIWLLSYHGINPVRRFLVNQVKIVFITFKGFTENNFILRASALTYYTMLSIVPVAALIFGIAKGFGFEKRLRIELTHKLAEHHEVLDWIINLSTSVLKKTNGGLIAGVGLIVLYFSVMNVLGNIEASFNNIWQIKKGRTFFRKFSDYLAITLIAPVFLILSGSLTVFIQTHVTTLIKEFALIGIFSPVFAVIFKITPYLLIWFVFSFLYIVMPNTVVKYSSGITAGIIAGTIFQFTQWLYLKFQIGMSSTNALYGSFAALPLFMTWLQIAWIILLFGAELSFALQNFKKYEYTSYMTKISVRYRRSLSLLIMQHIIKQFGENSERATVAEISNEKEIPVRICMEIMNDLSDAGLITEIASVDRKESYYTPSVDINLVTVKYVIDKLENVGIQDINIARGADYDNICKLLDDFDASLKSSGSNKLLIQI
jgi:membrane protein